MEHSQEISDIISDLLHHYDCVIVPELGGFVTEYRSARIDQVLNILHPPSKDLRFNAQLKKNDGLLANALSQAEEISHEEANSRIKEKVDSYFSDLELGKTVHFDKVGILYLDSQKNVQFRAEDSVNYLLESFHLKKVYAQPVTEVAEVKGPTPFVVLESKISEQSAGGAPELLVDAPEEILKPEDVEEVPVLVEVESDRESTPVVPISEKASGRKWMAAALIPLLFYLGLVALRSDVIRDGNIQMSDLNPFKKAVESNSYSPRSDQFEIVIESLPDETVAAVKETDVKAEDISDEIYPESNEEIIPEVEIIPAEPINTYVAPSQIATMEFHVVGGCFSELNNAERQVDRLRQKGYDAYIMDIHKGLHRVTYGNYSNRAQALEELKAIKEGEQSDAWLLRKK